MLLKDISSKGFITRNGLQLVDIEGHVFCFVSFNIPNLVIIEEPWRLPTKWEQKEALTAIAHQGGKAVRIYPPSVFDPEVNRPCHVNFDAETSTIYLNEDFSLVMDQALDVARVLGIRLIIPFVDQWTWHGGIQQYSKFRGIQGEDCDLIEAFFTDKQIREDFKRVISMLLNRVNTITGVKYKDDPVILAWETGNELNSPAEWTADIAAYVKELDPKHLVIDGRFGVDPASLDDPNIDIVSNHYYPNGTCETPLQRLLQDVQENCQGKKPLIVGEFGIYPLVAITSLLDEVLDLALNGKGVVGALLWSLRFRCQTGGFYWHTEVDDFYSYHWPGFPAGDRYDETEVLHYMRQAGYRAQGLPSPLPLAVPAPPTILSITPYGALTYRGSTSARSFEVQRAYHVDGPWAVIKTGLTDATEPMKASFLDETVMRLPAVRLFYQMIAVNESGRSAPSPVHPLMLCGDDLANPPTFYYGGRADRHLLQLSYNSVAGCWDTIDLSVKFNAPHVGRGNVSRFQKSSIVYCSATNHLVELDFLTGTVVDHTENLRVRIQGEPSVAHPCSGEGSSSSENPVVYCRGAKANHLYRLSVKTNGGGGGKASYSLEDLSKDLHAPGVCGAGPLATSYRHIFWVGENFSLYGLDASTGLVTDHSKLTKVRVTSNLCCLAKDKLVFAGAEDGHVYEYFMGDNDKDWRLVDHHLASGAPLVNDREPLLNTGAHIIYTGADFHTYELWYQMISWVVTDHTATLHNSLPMASPMPMHPVVNPRIVSTGGVCGHCRSSSTNTITCGLEEELAVDT